MSSLALISDGPALPSGACERIDAHAAADPVRTFSRTESEALFHRIVGLTTGGGDTSVSIHMAWVSGLRWARNHPTTSVIVRTSRVVIQRVVHGVRIQTETSQLDDASLKTVIAAAEQRLTQLPKEPRQREVLPPPQQYLKPPIWSDKTFNVTKQVCSHAAELGVDPVRTANLLAAGYLETRAVTWGIFNTKGLAAYAVGTSAHYSESVRNPEGTGAGWAGLMHTDWTKLDVARLSARAMQKCVASADPKAIEPGRYTAILEPQAAQQIMSMAVSKFNTRPEAEDPRGGHPFSGDAQGETKIGQKVLDERITISTDPMDPECPYIPFDGDGYPFRPVTWVENGVLKELAYDSEYARKRLDTDVPLLNPIAFRMSGGQATIEEMIATTQRGVLVTRFGVLRDFGEKSLLVSSVTRDGLWLIENGKIKYPVKNMRVLESPLFIGNAVEQLGTPERVFGSRWVEYPGDLDNYTPEALGNHPAVVPAMKVRDFNFMSLSDAV